MKKDFERRRNDRIFWIGTSSFLVFILLLVVLVPGLIAQTKSSNSEYLDLFTSVFNFVQDNYVDEVDPKTLFDGAMKGLFESLDDPHSTYLTATDMQDITEITSGEFGGVGLYITKPRKSDTEKDELDLPPYVRVVSPIEDTPASKAGISAGDYITKIEGASTVDLSIEEVVKRLRGTPGSPVKVTIQRGKTITFEVTLLRDNIKVPTTKKAMIHGNIGYLRIIQFSSLTSENVGFALDYFKKNNYKGLIIDVRHNPGGLLKSVVETADYFLSGGTIVSTKSRISSENRVYTAHQSTKVDLSIPIVILIDNGSASASEILSGALKDRHRALLVGETSFGKGSVQEVKSFGEGGFKLTMARYYTPSGENIDKIGIDPDREVKEKELTEEESVAFNKLVDENMIPKFIQNNPNPSKNEINRFVNSLKENGINLEDRILKRLISVELNKTNNNPPVYDMDYDTVLRTAVKMLEEGEVPVK